jgi:DedD protein
MTIRDADRIRDKLEVSLDGRQVFFLFFGGAVVACLVFVLGVMVGKRLEGRELVARRAATSAAIDPLAALDELGADEQIDPAGDELAFPSALAAGDKGRQRPLGTADLPAPRPAASAPAPAPAKPSEDRPRTVAPAVAAPPPPKAPAAPPPTAPPADGKPKFTLQISSFQERAEADALVSRLVGAGYKPFVVMSDVPDRGIFFRVRIGEYPSRQDALTAKEEFEKKQQIIAYVTRL